MRSNQAEAAVWRKPRPIRTTEPVGDAFAAGYVSTRYETVERFLDCEA